MENKLLIIVIILTVLLMLKINFESNTKVVVSQDIDYDVGDKPSPCDRLQREDFMNFMGGLWINTSCRVLNIANSSSMSPFIENEANICVYKPRIIHEICVGDIITYKTFDAEKNKTHSIVHRVAYKGRDREGYYLIMRGDNNYADDYGKVRFENVTGVVILIAY